PPGWRARVIASGEGPDRRWRVSWTCTDSGWEQEVTHRIRPGATLSGFAVELAAPDPTYTGGLYRASIDHEAPVVGRVFLAQAPPRRCRPPSVDPGPPARRLPMARHRRRRRHDRRPLRAAARVPPNRRRRGQLRGLAARPPAAAGPSSGAPL